MRRSAPRCCLQLLLEDDKPLSKIVAELPRYVIVKDKLNRPKAQLDTVYEALRAAFPDGCGRLAGWTETVMADRWVHIRPSGTEPIVRVIAEAPTDSEALDLVRRSREPLDALGA